MLLGPESLKVPGQTVRSEEGIPTSYLILSLLGSETPVRPDTSFGPRRRRVRYTGGVCSSKFIHTRLRVKGVVFLTSSLRTEDPQHTSPLLCIEQEHYSVDTTSSLVSDRPVRVSITL